MPAKRDPLVMSGKRTGQTIERIGLGYQKLSDLPSILKKYEELTQVPSIFRDRT